MISNSLVALSGRRKTPKCQLRLLGGEDRGWMAVTEQTGERVGLDK